MGTHRGLRQAAALLVLCFAGLAQATPTIGGPSPVDLIGKTPDGEEIRISEHRGQVLVVSFWASWCGFCRRQFPLLDHVQKEAGREQLRVVVVNFKEPASDYSRARRALRKSSVTWTHDRDGTLGDILGLRGVPYTLLFDKAGHLAAVRRGYSEEVAAGTIDLLNALLAEPAPPAAVPAEAEAEAMAIAAPVAS